MSWECPLRSHSRPLKGPRHPDRSCPVGSESGRPTTAPLCQPRQRLAARSRDQGYRPGTGDSSPREVSDSGLVPILPSGWWLKSLVETPLPFRARIPAPLAWIPPAVDPPTPHPHYPRLKECPSKAPCSSQGSKELQRSLQEAGRWGGGCSTGQAPRPVAVGLTPTQGQAATSTYRPRTGTGTPRTSNTAAPHPRDSGPADTHNEAGGKTALYQVTG